MKPKQLRALEVAIKEAGGIKNLGRLIGRHRTYVNYLKKKAATLGENDDLCATIMAIDIAFASNLKSDLSKLCPKTYKQIMKWHKKIDK